MLGRGKFENSYAIEKLACTFITIAHIKYGFI